jgi:CopG family transcriptional regulator, nickel-responsive regulator
MVRFGISLHKGLLEKFDAFIHAAGYRNRSAAIRDIVRDFLVTREWQKGNTPIAAIVSIVYHHSSGDVLRRLQSIKTAQRKHILSSTLHPLHEHYTLEVIVLNGPARMVKKIADALIGCRGVIHGVVTPTMPGPPCAE